MLLNHQPLSMPSTLVSDLFNPNGVLDLSQPQGLNTGWEATRLTKASENCPAGKSFWRRGSISAGAYHGLQTPPRERVEMDNNPLLVPSGEGLQYKSVPVVASNAPPHPSSHHDAVDSHSRHNSKSQPFYNSYYSAKRPTSPSVKKESVVPREQVARRRALGEGSSIVSYLQIPPMINDSKGSLPEFAAQITCLFWFESSSTLRTVEDSWLPAIPNTPLVPEAMPTTGFRKWVTTILSMTQVSQNVILLALMFIYRLKKLNPGVKGKVGSEFRLLTVALMLGNKFLDDNTYTNKTWADVSGISVQEIHVMEVEFLSNMRYTLFASKEEWNEWHVKLGRFSDYFDRAPKARTDSTLRSLALPVPFNNPPNLPSPPGSQHASPPFMTHPSPNNLPHPLSMPPYLAPSIPSPILPTPEVDLKPWSRKRNLEDYTSGPPTKRLSSMAPSAASSSTMTASTLQDNSSPAPRLPIPNLPIAAGTPHNGHGPSSAHLPLPSGRAMASVFSNPNRWPQNGRLPPLLQSPRYGPHGEIFTENQKENTVLNGRNGLTHSGTPSPTSHQFPRYHQTTNGFSPSGLPAPRNSPYKPIRGVSTLLVPPPSASMQNARQPPSYNQMHYQPLGKPSSERRAGVLPYLPFNTWSQSHNMQYHLPQPNFAL